MSFAVSGAIVGGAAGLGSAAIGLGGAALSGAGSLVAGAAGTVASGVTSLAGTAIGAGGAVLGGIGSLAGGIYQTGAGVVKGAGTMLFGGGEAVPGLTVGESFAALAEPGYYGEAAGGIFSNLNIDTISKVAGLGYNIYQTSEQMKLAEKAIAAQRGAGYVVAAPAGTTALSPTTTIAIPRMAAAKEELDKKVLVKYAVYGLIAYLLFKGFK